MLRIENVSKTYANGVQALNNVALAIPNGLFGLLGPNGAGKSSLMRTIATLQQCDQGSIWLDDIDVRHNPMEVRRQLGYLPQDFGVFPRFNAQRMLHHFATLKGIPVAERKDTVEGLLAMVNLWDTRKRKLGTYSGGMRQRFGVALALLGNPRLIIVDEPAAGLDPEERQRLMNLLSEIGEKVIIILSTHFVGNVRDLCNNMAILAQGQALVKGKPEELVAQKQGRIWQAVLEKEEAIKLGAHHEVLSSRLLGGRTALRAESVHRPDNRFENVAATLEDAYFSALKKGSISARSHPSSKQQNPELEVV